MSSKLLPVADRDTQGFWDACGAHELCAQRCQSCGHFRWPPRSFCPRCYSFDFEWAPLPKEGKVVSFTVVHHGTETPYVVALIGLNEEVQLMSNVVDCAWEDVRVGMPVAVVFDEDALPRFRPL